MNSSNFNDARRLKDTTVGAAEDRLVRRSSLVTCCGSTQQQVNATSDAAATSSSTLHLSPLIKVKSGAEEAFVIRDYNKSASAVAPVAAICQPNGRQTYTFFSAQGPISQGQKPTLTMGGRILYKLGRVSIQLDENDEGSFGMCTLWNGRLVSFSISDVGEVKLRRLSSDGDDLVVSNDSEDSTFEKPTSCFLQSDDTNDLNEQSVDDLLKLCLASLPDGVKQSVPPLDLNL